MIRPHLLLGCLLLIASMALGAQEAKLRLLSTTDIHSHILSFDYYKGQEVQTYGLARTATLIQQARNEVKNSLLVDNGDLIQGNPLADWAQQDGMNMAGAVHPAIKALNALSYDVAAIGNHEFNYGLDYLNKVIKGAKFPFINSNIYNVHDQKNSFTPTLLITKELIDDKGTKRTIKIGFFSVAPVEIMNWDGDKLKGKVTVKNFEETAKTFVPQLKQQGADLIIALVHEGLGRPDSPNSTFAILKTTGVNAIILGHEHHLFPPTLESAQTLPVPAVMANFWGDHLGIIDLNLKWDTKTNQWQILSTATQLRPTTGAESDVQIAKLISAEHQATLKYLETVAGQTTAAIQSYFALIADDPSVQLINMAQRWYGQKRIQGTPWEKLPILAASAPFKTGGQGNDYYTDIASGDLTLRNIADLYLYPNTVKIVKVTGREIREWLEMSAGLFFQIDPQKRQEQQLINPDFKSYNFDVIDGVSYQIDLTQPPRYDGQGKLVRPTAHRIVKLTYEKRPIQDKQEFLVVTNNYRAGGGGNFPALSADRVVLDLPDTNREAILAYVREVKRVNPTPDQNWRFKPVKLKAPLLYTSNEKSLGHLFGFNHIIESFEKSGQGQATYKLKLEK